MLNLIDHLPGASHYAEAQANDDEFARLYVAARRDDGPGLPRVSEWDPHRAELANITDLLQQVVAAVAALGGTEVRPRPRPRPETAFDRARRAQRQADHLRLVQRVRRQPESG